jgi:RND family efflux transporter MFP subunit
MQRKLVVSLVLILAILGVSLGLAVWLVRTAPEAPQVEVLNPPLLVKAIRIEPCDIVEPLVGYGTARAERRARLSAQVAGEVIELAANLKIGASVSQNEILLRIDDREYREQLLRAESLLAAVAAQLAEIQTQQSNIDQLLEPARRELASAEWEFNKVRDLYDQQVAPKREYERAQLVVEQTRRMVQELENQKSLLPTRREQLEANHRNHQAEQEIARLNVERCTIRAPFDGRVSEKQVETGERVQIGSVLLAILDPDLIEVPVELPISIRPKVRLQAACELTLPSRPGLSWKGAVKRIAPAASETTRTFELFVEVSNVNQAQALVPGYFVRAEIEGPAYRDVLVVPRNCVQQSQVFVWRNGQAVARQVEVREQFADRSIIAGIEPGSIVIASNFDALYDGAAVRLDGDSLAAGVPVGQTMVSQAQPPAAEQVSDPPTEQK